MFGCSRSGYYAWLKRHTEPDEKKQEALKEKHEIMEGMRKIVQKLGYVPGKRTFRTYLWHIFKLDVSVKRCKKYMREMGLIARKPKKDAYKHQACHDHVCDCPPNPVAQNFYLGPRRVILTDITYLYYGANRTTFYLCAFKDAYTKEILGHAAGNRMTVELVKTAYDRMMEKHRSEIPSKIKVYIHSDQGSQYTSTTFQQILKDDGFVQSVSGRGNSQDNAPMESFFAHTKTAVLDLVALCPDLETAVRLIDNYINAYNTEQYQYNLAGLTPEEFYIYITTGIYPLDNYYGIKLSEMNPFGSLIQKRLEIRKEEAEKRRKAYQKKNEERNKLHCTPLQLLARDQKLLTKEKNRWIKQKDLSAKQITRFDEILQATKTAGLFLKAQSEEVLELLRDPQQWKNYPELDYVTMMKEMF